MPRPEPDRALVADVRAALAAAADPALAPGMQAYMKSALPYYGVRAAGVRALAKECIARRPPADREIWDLTVRALFDEATHREERYVALALSGHRSARAWQDPEALVLYRHLVVVGAWWDVVDAAATGLVGPILRSHRPEVDPVIRAWAVDDDLWLRRTAVISQVGSKTALDLDLLEACLVPNLERPEFWLRKACGWALRDMASRHPAWVVAFVAAHPEMAGLTRREATKHLVPSVPGPVAGPPEVG